MSEYSILVVDDRPDNFEVIEALLAANNYTLHYATCGEDAIAGLDAFAPDAILLDVMMPGIDGLETCRRIKAMAQWQAVPIIMVTALNETADLARCLEAGADDFISKPIDGVELRARLQSMLRIKKQHDRIQSLSKLQRNNIHFLENSLHELHLDLAVSFPDELNAPVYTTIDNTRLLQQNFRQMEASEVKLVLDKIEKSAIDVDKLTQSFLFYLQLSLPSKSTHYEETCNVKSVLEKVFASNEALRKTFVKLNFDLEDAFLSVTSSHIQYIFNALFDRLTEDLQNIKALNIYGRETDGAFHFCIDNRVDAPKKFSEELLSDLMQLNLEANSDGKLGIGLKIVKKIVEIYDGLFLIVTTPSRETSIYITLPLANKNRQIKL